MKKVKFIYNPYSGEKSIINKVDKVIKVHQKHGYSIIPYRIELDNGLEKAIYGETFLQIKEDSFDFLKQYIGRKNHEEERD